MDNQNSPPRPPTETEDSFSQHDATGLERTHTPFESPARSARPPMPSTPGGMQYSVPSTPGSHIYGIAPGTPSGSYSLNHGSKMAVELSTPVISNANTKYVDDNRKGTPPSQLGLPDARPLVDKSTSYGVPSSGLAPRTFVSRGAPHPFLKQSNNRPGLGVMQSLEMPSGLYSDDSSLEDGATNESILRPVELKPNRFHSFQGPSQYERKKRSQPVTLSPAIEHPNTSPGASNAGQYMPNIRNAHGVKELSDTKDLDAIFKDDRPTPSRSNTSLMNTKIVSPMSIDGEDDRREEPISTEILNASIPMNERDWSIPSIRLANHVNTFGMDGSIHSYHTLFSDEEDYTDDGGSSYDGSYVDGDDDDDVSLSSKESYDKVKRWRRISGVLRRSQSQASAGEDEDMVMVPPPQVTRTVPAVTSDLDGNEDDEVPLAGTSLLEQHFSGIAIDNNDQSANPPGSSSTAIIGPPSILNVTAQSFDDNAVAAPSQGRPRRRHKKKRRAHSHAAIEWIHTLQQTTASEGNQIIEAASSKFLTGTGNKNEESENKDTKALGLPHPLCRSSTIEAGGFAYGVEA